MLLQPALSPSRFRLLMASSFLLVGLDVGGSKTLLYGEQSGAATRIERRGPGANPNRVGQAEAATILGDIVASVLEDAPRTDRLVVAAGVSGAGDDAVQAALASALRAHLSRPGMAVQIEVTHDGLIALDAAYDAESGAIIIAGTGSVVLARGRDGGVLRSGGWGPILGDDGSGYALGRHGLRAVAEAFDGGRGTALCSHVEEAFGIDDRPALIHAVHNDDLPLQDIAPMVVAAAREGDAAAQRVLDEQITALVRQVTWIAAEVTDMAPRLTLLGGLMKNDHYRQVLHTRLRTHVPNWSVQRLDAEPALGALRRAHRLAQRPDAA